MEWCAYFLQEMVLERGIEVLLHSRVIDAQADNGYITELTVSTAGGDNDVPYGLWAHLTDATFTVDGRTLVDRGTLRRGR